MSAVLRPILRTNRLPSLPSSAITTTYICQSCRHARLLRRPKRPYTFTQLVVLSDGSAFTMRSTSPLPVYRSSRDTRNSTLWNPSSADLLNIEEDEAGRLAGFRSRFGTAYDASKAQATTIATESTTESPDTQTSKAEKIETQKTSKREEDELDFGFEDDDAGILEMISSYGTADKGSASQVSKKRK